jgi:hypothetical protein
MRRYLNDNQPQNVGQFLGQTLSGTVAPYLENRRQQGILDAQTAKAGAFKERDWLADENYRQSTLGETRRHNLAVEGKPEKGTDPYASYPDHMRAYLHLNDMGAAGRAKYGVSEPDFMRIKQQAFSEGAFAPKPPNISASDITPDVIGTGLTGYDKHQDETLSTDNTLSPTRYFDTRIGPGLPRLGSKWPLFNNPQARDSIRTGFLNAAGPGNDTTQTGGGFGPDGSFNSEEEWQQAKREMGL